jgi:hypothetical protein
MLTSKAKYALRAMLDFAAQVRDSAPAILESKTLVPSQPVAAMARTVNG